jgi:nickel-dependent lactate racemase
VEYAESQGRLIDLGMERFLEETSRKKYASIDEWESVMQVKAMRTGNIYLYSEGLTAEERGLTGVHMVRSVKEAVEESVMRQNDTRVAVIPEGPYIIPFYRPGS